MDSYLPGAGIQYYWYDQLGSAYSDQPDEPSLWEIDRFVDEVEQVRQALGLDRRNFYLYGHSWGGMLGIEYALAHQDHLKGLIVSNTRYDTMDPRHMEEMSRLVQHGRFLYCPNGSHLAIYDDQQTYFDGLIKFIEDVDREAGPG